MSRQIALLADYPELIPRLAKWRWDEWGHLDPAGSLDEWKERLAKRVHRDRIPLTVIALEDEQPVGMASLLHYDMDIRRDLSLWLAGVLVPPASRRRGIGSALVTVIEQHASALGVDILYLYTNNTQRFYAKLGWQVIEQESYRGQDVVLMSKVIGDE
jgi:N-acetylglutamate synthase-like GNAT family acetyltransferase